VAKEEAQPRLDFAYHQEARDDERRQSGAHGAQQHHAQVSSGSPLTLHATFIHREVAAQKCWIALSSRFGRALSNV
jgi:hypothetical protein